MVDAAGTVDENDDLTSAIVASIDSQSIESQAQELAELIKAVDAILVGVGCDCDKRIAQDLADILASVHTDSFVVASSPCTENFLTRIIPQGEIWPICGDEHYLQCSLPCHDELYPADKAPERCPQCHRALIPWTSDTSGVFLMGAKWKRGQAEYQAFLERHLCVGGGSDDADVDVGVDTQPDDIQRQGVGVNAQEAEAKKDIPHLLLLQLNPNPDNSNSDSNSNSSKNLSMRERFDETIGQPFWSIASLHPEARLLVVADHASQVFAAVRPFVVQE